MKTAVVLRHAERRDRSDNSSHLSAAGIAQARKAGTRFGAFDLVVASPLPRATETAVAMGFAVTKNHPGIQDIGERVLQHVHWSDGFLAWAQAYRSAPLVTSYVDYVASLVKGWLDEVGDDGSLLVVTHGGIVEAMAVGLAPGSNFGEFGTAAGYAEGFTARDALSGQFALEPFGL